MTQFKFSVLALAVGLTVSACGSEKAQQASTASTSSASEQSGAFFNPKAQQQNPKGQGFFNENAIYFASFNTGLLDPIVISDQVSDHEEDTAVDDFERYAEIVQRREPALQKAAVQVQQEADKQGEEPSREFTEQLQAYLTLAEEAEGELAGLSMLDPEVNALRARHLQLMRVSSATTQAVAELTVELKSAPNKVKENFRKQTSERQEQIKQARQTLQEALDQFQAKHS